MQATSPVYRQSVDTGLLTGTGLVLIGIFAALVVLALVYGARQAAKRRAARKIEGDRVEAGTSAAAQPTLGDAAAPATAAPPPLEPSAPEPVAIPAPLAPSPPPLDPGPVAGTPAADPLPEAPDVTDEPIAAAAPLEASPATEAEPAPAEPSKADGGARPVTILKGLGPKVAARLGELGIATVGELATLDDAQAAGIDARLGPFTGRMARDRWLEQARLLASGDDRAFEAEFGKL